MNKLYALPATAAVFALAAPAGIATAQEGDDGPLLGQSATSVCGQAEVTLTNDSEHTYGWNLTAGPNGDGDRFDVGTYAVEAGSERVVQVPLPEGSYGGEAFIGANTVYGPESDLFLGYDVVATVQTDCATEPPDDDEGDEQPPADDEGDGAGDDAPPTDEGSSGDHSGSGDADEGDDTDDGDTDGIRPGGQYPVGAPDTGGGPA